MKAENLLKDAVEAIEVGSKIGDKVIVMGFSLGGALMSIVASDQISSEKLDYLILLAPAHSKFTSTYFMIALISFLTGGIEADYAELYGLDNEWNQYWSTKVDREELHELLKIPNLSDQIGFKHKEVPLLLVYNNHDAVVPEEGIKKNYKKWKGPKKIYDLKIKYFRKYSNNLVKPREGVLNIINYANRNNIKLGFITTTSKETIEIIKDNLSQYINFNNFDLITYEKDCSKKKPNPDIYNFAIKNLNVAKNNSITIEDTPVSYISSKKANIKTILFPGEYSVNKNNISSSYKIFEEVKNFFEIKQI